MTLKVAGVAYKSEIMKCFYYNKSDISCLKKNSRAPYPYNKYNSAQAKLTAAAELRIIVTMLQ